MAIRDFRTYFVNGPLWINTGIVHTITDSTKAGGNNFASSSFSSTRGVQNKSVTAGSAGSLANGVPVGIHSSAANLGANVLPRDKTTTRGSFDSGKADRPLYFSVENANNKTTIIKPGNSSMITAMPDTQWWTSTNESSENGNSKMIKSMDASPSSLWTVTGPLIFVAFVVDKVSVDKVSDENATSHQNKSTSPRIEFTIRHPDYKTVIFSFSSCFVSMLIVFMTH